MSDVAVVGLGATGSALARALVKGRHRVTVWNRTESKAVPLMREGAAPAPDLASGVAASPVVIVCLRDHQLGHTLLSTPDVRLYHSDRAVLQPGCATSQEARHGERWADERRAAHL